MVINNLKEVKEYINSGLPIIPLKRLSKQPVQTGWTTLENGATFNDFEGDSNIGILLGRSLKDGTYIHALDFDLWGDELNDWVDTLTTLLGINEDNAVYQTSASNSLHFFIRTTVPLNKDVRRIALKVTDEKGNTITPGKQIELLGLGQQVLLAPSIAKGKDGKYRQYELYGDIQKAPLIDLQRLREFFKEGKDLSEVSNESAQETVIYTKKQEGKEIKYSAETYNLVNIYDLEEILEKISISYKKSANYLKVLCPFHAEDKGSFIIYRNSGMCVDFHDGRKMSLIELISILRPDDWKEMLWNEYFIKIKDEVVEEVHDDPEEGDIIIPEFSRDEEPEPEIAKMLKVQGEEVVFRDYIGEKSSEIERILLDEYNYNLIAATGAGKNHALINKAKELNLLTILLSPYESTVVQISKKYKVPAIWGEVTMEEAKIALESNHTVVATYDSFVKLKYLLGETGLSNYTLIVDEYHNFITQLSFRSKAITEVVRHLSYFRKVITITGTPEGIIANDYRTVIFKREKEPELIKNYKIIEYQDHGVEKLTEHALNNRGDGITVIFKNNIDTLHEIKNALVRHGLKEDEIGVLSSKNKDDDAFTEITVHEAISSKIRYLLTTSVISDGVNILNDNISSVYLLDLSDMIQLRQFMARFRRGVQNVYDFIKNGSGNSMEWLDVEPEIRKRVKYYEKFAKIREKYFSSIRLVQNAGKISFIDPVFKGMIEEHNLLFIDPETEEVKVNESKVRLQVLNALYSIMLKDSCKRKEYLEAFAGNIKVDIEKITKDAELSLAEDRQKVEDENERILSGLFLMLNRDRNAVLTTYLKEVNRKLLKEEESSLKGLIDEKVDTLSYYRENKEVFVSRITERELLRYIRLYKYGFSHGLIMRLLAASPQRLNRFEERFKIKRMLYVLENAKEILPYTRKSLNIANFHMLRFILEQLKDKDRFISGDLYSKFKKFQSGNNLKAKITQGKMIQAIGNVFNIERGFKRVNVNGRWRTESKGYVIHGLLSFEDIFSDLEVEFHLEDEEEINETIKIWLKDKVEIFYLKIASWDDKMKKVVLGILEALGSQNSNNNKGVDLAKFVTDLFV
jgi:superfamily II DNA or RNA helicase/uncharacterized protein YnzC (UPF0291/DUF896 family)